MLATRLNFVLFCTQWLAFGSRPISNYIHYTVRLQRSVQRRPGCNGSVRCLQSTAVQRFLVATLNGRTAELSDGQLLRHALCIAKCSRRPLQPSQTKLANEKLFSAFRLLTFSLVFYRATAATAVARLSRRNSVRPSVRLSHGWISQKGCKLKSPNRHRRLTGRLVSGAVKLFHKFEGGHPERRR